MKKIRMSLYFGLRSPIIEKMARTSNNHYSSRRGAHNSSNYDSGYSGYSDAGYSDSGRHGLHYSDQMSSAQSYRRSARYQQDERSRYSRESDLGNDSRHDEGYSRRHRSSSREQSGVDSQSTNRSRQGRDRAFYDRSSYGRGRQDTNDYQSYSRESYLHSSSSQSSRHRGTNDDTYSRYASRYSPQNDAFSHNQDTHSHSRHARKADDDQHVQTRYTQSQHRRSYDGGADSSDQALSRYSRDVSGQQYTKRSKQKKSKKKKVIIGVLVAVCALFVAFGGTAFAFLQNISSNLADGLNSEIRAALVDTQYKDDPFYMLLLGIDKSEARVEDGEWGSDSFRTDSMMLVRVDPKSCKVTMISLLRDTLVNMGEYGNHKLNEAYAYGGASLAIDVVSKFAGVQISHYAEIDLNGFEAMVDALGGVEVDVPMEIDDPEAGGYLAAGLQTLNGEQALILCRTRHTYDNYGSGDMYRASNQRVVLSAIAQKLLSANILAIANTASALSEYVVTDLSVSDIVGYAQVLRGIDASTDIYTASEPTGSIYIDYGWYEYVKKPEWVTMMERTNQGLSPTESSETDETGTVLSNAGETSTDESSSSSSSSSSSTSKKETTVNIKALDWSKFNGYDYYEYASLGSPDGVTGNVYGESGLIY